MPQKSCTLFYPRHFKPHRLALCLSVIFFLMLATPGQAQPLDFEKKKDIFLHPSNYPEFITIAAHRGYFKDVPENSLEAIQKAIELNVSMVELDLKLTKDNVVVLAHDYDLGRLTTCPVNQDCLPGEHFIRDYTFDQLRNVYKIKLKNRDGTATESPIPTLAEALDLCKGKILVDLDKIDQNADNPNGVVARPFIDKVYEVINSKNMFDQVIVKFKASDNSKRIDNAWTVDKLKRSFPTINWKKLMVTPIYFSDNVLPGIASPTALDFKISVQTFNEEMNLVGAELIYSGDFPDDKLARAYEYVKTVLKKQVIQFASYPETRFGHYAPMSLKWATSNFDDEKNIHWDWLFAGKNNTHMPTLIITDRLDALLEYMDVLGKQNSSEK